MLDPQFTDARNFFPLGGFLNLSGLPADTLSGPQLGIVRLIYMRKLGNGGEGFLNLPLYAGASFETGNTWRSRSDMDFGEDYGDYGDYEERVRTIVLIRVERGEPLTSPAYDEGHTAEELASQYLEHYRSLHGSS